MLLPGGTNGRWSNLVAGSGRGSIPSAIVAYWTPGGGVAARLRKGDFLKGDTLTMLMSRKKE